MLVTLILAFAAIAQDNRDIQIPDELDVQTWRLPIDSQRTLWTDDSTYGGDQYVSARLAVSYLRAPFVFEWSDTHERVNLVSDAVGFDLVGAYSVSRLRLGIDLPVYALAQGDVTSGGGLGDIALDVKGTILEKDDAPVGLALDTRLTLPTGNVKVPVAGGGLDWELDAIVDK